MSFFESEIVQQEAKQLFEDYQALIQLGNNYGKFDRQGKIMFIGQMEAMMERYRIFMKRFELSEDFMAKMTMEQLKTQLSQGTCECKQAKVAICTRGFYSYRQKAGVYSFLCAQMGKGKCL